jgi:CubicO group peptidase (beta-lactamase class C family)/pimeloyl-ACP methyl ester carboxylesterase
MFSIVKVLCVLLAVSSYALAQTENLPPGMQAVIRDLDGAASQAVKNPTDIGYTLGVVTRNGLAWTQSYGFADSGRARPAGADTEYAIGTGAFTAVMLLQLARDGKVHLSDPAQKYVAELKSVRSQYPDAAPVTLMQLALHTSGLDVGSIGANGNGVVGWDKNLLAALPNAQYAFEPGTHAAASSIEDSVLALALSRATNQPYDEYVQARILAPLGMSHSRVSNGGQGLNPVLQTTIGDVSRFASFLMLGGPETVLSRKELEENYRRVWVGNSVAVANPSEWFGIGYDGETWTSNHYYFIPSIGSTQPGFDATFWFEPRRHAGVILLHQGAGAGVLGQMIHTYVYTLNAQKVDAGRQDPVKPLPYTEEEVAFENKAAEIKLAGSLTIPSGSGPFPAVVLIPKSGPMDRDERILNHRPFVVLADYLTRAGIAVLRTDVRGVGKSGGKFAGAQAADFAGDVEAAMEYLRTRKEVNAGRVGFLSHGEGGQVAAIAAARNPNAAFVVMLGAAAVPQAENSVEGSRLSAEANGELPAKAEAQAYVMRGIMTIVLRESDPATLEKDLRDFLTGKFPDAQIAPQIRQWTSAAFRTAMSYDPRPELKKITCPVLALYAEKDFTVPAKLNVPAMRAALAANKAGEVEELPDLNLLFQTADVGIGREANWAEETMSPAVLKKVADWVVRQDSRR